MRLRNLVETRRRGLLKRKVLWSFGIRKQCTDFLKLAEEKMERCVKVQPKGVRCGDGWTFVAESTFKIGQRRRAAGAAVARRGTFSAQTGAGKNLGRVRTFSAGASGAVASDQGT